MVVGAIPPISPPPPAAPATATTAPSSTASADPNSSFSSAITNALDSLQQTQTAAANDEALSAAGQGNLADTMIAASQSSLDTQVTSSLLTKAIDSYNSIMDMTF